MKKLSLKKLNLGTNDLLQKNQLKTVFGGGYGDFCYGCSTICWTNSYSGEPSSWGYGYCTAESRQVSCWEYCCEGGSTGGWCY